MDRRAAEAAACIAPLRAGAGKPHFPANLALHLTWPAPRLLGSEVALPRRGIPAKGGSAPSTQTQQLWGVGNDAGERRVPQGAVDVRWSCSASPRGTNVRRGHAQARQSCGTTGKREAAVRSPWRLHCGLKDGSVPAAAAKRLRQAASAPLGGHPH